MESNEHALELRIQALEEKMNNFSKILQNFGLDLIHSIGAIKHEMTTLSNKSERVETSLIEIKGIKTELHEMMKNQRKWYQLMEGVNVQLKNLNQKMIEPSSLAGNNEVPYSRLNEKPHDILSNLRNEILSAKSVHDLHQSIKKAKERIFVLTGGHKILLELRAYEQKASRDSNIQFDNFQQTLLEKVHDWEEAF